MIRFPFLSNLYTYQQHSDKPKYVNHHIDRGEISEIRVGDRLTNRWLLVADDQTWTTLVKSGFWKLGRRYKRVSRKIRREDRAVAYVKYFSAIYGIVKITSETYENKQDVEYPVRFDMEPEVFLSEPISIRPLINSLSFIRNKERWYGYFQTSLRKVPEKDFELIRGYVIRESVKNK